MSSGASALPGGSPVAGWAWPSRSLLSLKGCAASIPRGVPQFLFNPEQPVVLGRPVGPGQRARLDLAGVQAHGQVRDRHVLCLPRPVGHDGRVPRPLRHLDRLQRLRQRADLVQLDEDRVPNALRDPLRKDLRVGHKDVVANELHPMPQPLSEHLPALPVLLAQSVFDRDDRIAPDEALVIPDHILAGPPGRSEEHTSELQSPCNLVCRLLLEKKNIPNYVAFTITLSTTQRLKTTISISRTFSNFSHYITPSANPYSRT